MNLHLGQADVAIRIAHRARHGKFVKADGPVDLVHIELGVLEGAQLHAGPLRHIHDAANPHRLHRVRAHGAPLADLDAAGVLFQHQFDQRLEHARIRGESGIGRHRNHRVDLDQHLIALMDDIVHPSHRLVRDLADHRLYQIELLPCVLRRFPEVRVAVRDRNGRFLCHK